MKKDLLSISSSAEEIEKKRRRAEHGSWHHGVNLLAGERRTRAQDYSSGAFLKYDAGARASTERSGLLSDVARSEQRERRSRAEERGEDLKKCLSCSQRILSISFSPFRSIFCSPLSWEIMPRLRSVLKPNGCITVELGTSRFRVSRTTEKEGQPLCTPLVVHSRRAKANWISPTSSSLVERKREKR